MKRRWRVSALDAAKNYEAAETLINDLAFGQLDLAGAEGRIRDLYDVAFKAGATAYAEWATDQVAKLAAENRALRVRLVQKSIADSQAVA